MSDSNNSVSPLLQRMIEDMTMRKLGRKTQRTYLSHVAEPSKYPGFSPHKATPDEL